MTFDLLLASIFLNVILGYHYWLKCRENEEMKKYRIKPNNNLWEYLEIFIPPEETAERLQGIANSLISEGIDHRFKQYEERTSELRKNIESNEITDSPYAEISGYFNIVNKVHLRKGYRLEPLKGKSCYLEGYVYNLSANSFTLVPFPCSTKDEIKDLQYCFSKWLGTMRICFSPSYELSENPTIHNGEYIKVWGDISEVHPTTYSGYDGTYLWFVEISLFDIFFE